MIEQPVFDVYEGFQVMVRPTDAGYMAAYRLGQDGKRSRLHIVVVENDADVDEIVRHLEAALHEIGRSGTAVRHVES